MASKKKRNRPRPPTGPRPAAKAGRPAAKTGAPPAPEPAAGQAKTTTRPPKERTGPTRAERLAAAEAARRRKALRDRILVLGAIAAVITVITVTVLNTRRSNARVIEQLEASGACEYDTRTDSLSAPPGNHVTGNIVYEVDPPSGGNHNPSPSPPGIFTVENRPADSNIVHSLEHGYIAIWHRPDIDPAQLDELRDLAARHERDVLLVPRESMDVPVAATAWHRRLLCSRLDVGPLERFVTEFVNEGPEKVPH
ncbi:MAG TPA: DUF3105 domain-containing protein [Acidimicrobiales bacterium]|nr:DUF3105 domain-containing protein [Acidimicrobiales bacterium]